MTRDDADDLARRIHVSWPGVGHVGLDEWADELLPLDTRLAVTTLVRLRRELDRPPTIARFHATYRALARAEAPTGPDPVPWDGTTLEHGMATARAAYLAECERQDRPPTGDILERLTPREQPRDTPRGVDEVIQLFPTLDEEF